MGDTPAVAATSLIVGALRWRRDDFWFNLFSGDAGVAAPAFSLYLVFGS